MHSFLKQPAAVLISAGFLFLIYYGSFMPIIKSQMYIKARQTQVNSLEQFIKLYDGIFSYASPVGQEEVVANYLELIALIIDQEGRRENPNKENVKTLVGKAEEWALPIVNRRSGFSFSQLLFSLGGVYRSATIVLQDRAYYQKAIDMYQLGLEFSPDRQIFLYSLFDMYRFGGDMENARKIVKRIVEVYGDRGAERSLPPAPNTSSTP